MHGYLISAFAITVFSIAYGLSQLFFGPVGDRYGKYFVIACGSMGCAVTSLMCALAQSFPLLLFARLLAARQPPPSFRCRWPGSATSCRTGTDSRCLHAF